MNIFVELFGRLHKIPGSAFRKSRRSKGFLLPVSKGMRSLRLEQLETRTLLSAGGTASFESLGFSLGPYVESHGWWLDLDPGDGLDAGAAVDIEITRSTPGGVSGQVAIPGVWIDTVTLDGREFLQWTLPEYGYTNVVGEPQLPIVRNWLLATDAFTATARVEGETQLLSITGMGWDCPIAPVQRPLSKLPGGLETAALDWNELVYQVDRFGPEDAIQVSIDGMVADQQLVMLEIAPFTYNPMAGALEIFQTMKFDVDFGTYASTPVPLSGRDAARLADLAINFNSDSPSVKSTLGKSGGRLLVITHDDFANDLADYVAHKTALGWTVDVADTSTAGTTSTAIRSYIQSRYNHLETRPDAVLLVGDTDWIPHFIGSGYGTPATDLYYGCMDGGDDWYQEFPVGRFSVTNSTELAHVIEKTIVYETSSSSDWTRSAVFMASVDNYSISEGTHNWVIGEYLDPLGYTSDKLYQVTYDATTQDVRDSFNEGRLLGVYSGHGSTYSWSDGPSFSQNDVENLTNAGMYPFLASFACVTGDYVVDECLMETWLRTEDNGAAIAVGSSVNSYWDEDDILERRLFDAIFDQGYAGYGNGWIRAKELLLQHYGATSTVRRYFEMYNILGDPTLEVIPIGPDESGAMVVGHSLGGTAMAPSVISFQFSEAMDTTSFSIAEDVVRFTGPGGDLMAQITGFSWVDSRTLEIHFLEQTEIGGYTMVLGPNIMDDAPDPNPMNQDRDAVDGEVPDDQYILEFEIIDSIYFADMDTDPGWSLDAGSSTSRWEWGQPLGRGGEYGNPDPISGWTGNQVMGYSLQGDYANNISTTQWATTPALDCSHYVDVVVEFQRWLNVESPAYDHAYFQVSNNGTVWQTLWSNSEEVTDSSWVPQSFDISSIADGQPAVSLRWGLGATDSSWRYSGWNIDDVLVLGNHVDRQGPGVMGVFVRGNKWSSEFLTSMEMLGIGQIDKGYRIPTGTAQLDPLPWPGIQRISIVFDEDVNVARDDLKLYGIEVSEYTPTTFSYDHSNFTATWILDEGIGTAEVLTLVLEDSVTDLAGNPLDGEWTNEVSAYPSGNNVSGGDFEFDMNLVPGDIDRDGALGQHDIEIVINHWEHTTAGMTPDAMIRHGDMNFSGVTDSLDWRYISQAWTAVYGTSLNLSELLAAKSGDFNNDQITNAIDLQAWLQGVGTFLEGGAVPADGDADADGDVDGNDFLIWQQHTGSDANNDKASAESGRTVDPGTTRAAGLRAMRASNPRERDDDDLKRRPVERLRDACFSDFKAVNELFLTE